MEVKSRSECDRSFERCLNILHDDDHCVYSRLFSVWIRNKTRERVRLKASCVYTATFCSLFSYHFRSTQAEHSGFLRPLLISQHSRGLLWYIGTWLIREARGEKKETGLVVTAPGCNHYYDCSSLSNRGSS